MKNKKNLYYPAIVLYGIVLLAVMLGTDNLYGSKTDWISQHIVFPDAFRKIFIESKQLVPNFMFNIGGGQNIFNFIYYGFLSPVVLLSYMLPFVDMTVYMICASIILYLSCGVLAYQFLKSHFSENSSFLAAIVFLSLPPVNFHFHHQI